MKTRSLMPAQLCLAATAAALAEPISSIEATDLTTGERYRVADASTHPAWPTVSGSWTVWHDERNVGTDPPSNAQLRNLDIYARNLDTGEELAVCTAPYNQSEPCISGNLVVWQDCRNGTDYDIWAYDLDTRTERCLVNAPNTQYRPRTDGTTLVWGDARNGEPDIYGMDLATEAEFPICVAHDGQHWPVVSGEWVAWADFRDGAVQVYAKNLSTGEEIRCSPEWGFEPAIAGDVIAWRTYGHDEGTARDIQALDLLTRQVFDVANSPDDEDRPAVYFDGNDYLAVWHQRYHPMLPDDPLPTDLDVWGATLTRTAQGLALAAASQPQALAGPFSVYRFPIAWGPGDQWDAVVDGPIVAWRDTMGDWIPEPTSLGLLALGLAALAARRKQ